MRCSGNHSPCLTTVQPYGTLYFFNEAATGLIGLFPAVDGASSFGLLGSVPHARRWPTTGRSSQNKSLASLGLV